jgi:hypothetical protein
MQKALHEFVSSGINLGQGTDTLERIGDVAAPAAGDGKLGHRPRPCFVYVDRPVWFKPRQLGRAKASRGSATYDGDFLHIAKIIKTYKYVYNLRKSSI